VGDVMTREVVACKPNDSLQDVQALMALNHKSRVMVLDDEQKLVGVISLSDIAQQDAVGFVSRTLRQVSEREVRGYPY
jgi:CBS-domain-containing membrane protein